MTLYDTRFELHVAVADLPQSDDSFLHRLESLIDYDDRWDWEAEPRQAAPLFNAVAKPIDDEIVF